MTRHPKMNFACIRNIILFQDNTNVQRLLELRKVTSDFEDCIDNYASDIWSRNFNENNLLYCARHNILQILYCYNPEFCKNECVIPFYILFEAVRNKSYDFALKFLELGDKHPFLFVNPYFQAIAAARFAWDHLFVIIEKYKLDPTMSCYNSGNKGEVNLYDFIKETNPYNFRDERYHKLGKSWPHYKYFIDHGTFAARLLDHDYQDESDSDDDTNSDPNCDSDTESHWYDPNWGTNAYIDEWGSYYNYEHDIKESIFSEYFGNPFDLKVFHVLIKSGDTQLVIRYYEQLGKNYDLNKLAKGIECHYTASDDYESVLNLAVLENNEELAFYFLSRMRDPDYAFNTYTYMEKHRYSIGPVDDFEDMNSLTHLFVRLFLHDRYPYFVEIDCESKYEDRLFDALLQSTDFLEMVVDMKNKVFYRNCEKNLTKEYIENSSERCLKIVYDSKPRTITFQEWIDSF